jgi:formate--tetrahydrofolate ligase
MLTDLEIASQAQMLPIGEVAVCAGLEVDDIEMYGKYKAKIGNYAQYLADSENSNTPNNTKLILVTAINPTPAGEGKTTTTVGLADALNKIGHPTIAALREPSLGPVFGIKGGAAGGGYAQVVPMEDINLHFTGDFHAIGTANNLLAALLDNHIKQGNELNINPATITLKRVVDMNDRQLRFIVDGLAGTATGNGNTVNGVPREDGFDITVASEVMAIFCLASSLSDLKQRLKRIIVAHNFAGEPVTAGDLKAAGAMTALLKEAIKPNLVQTLEGNPVIIHGGPFANIAHGCNSVIATKTGCGLVAKLSEKAQTTGYVVTEAGFGADLGAEKFIDIKCQLSGESSRLYPDAVVVVATIRALKSHGGVAKADLNAENLPALEAGLPNLLQHIDNLVTEFNLPVVVALNKFPTDSAAEVELVRTKCASLGIQVELSDVWAQGSAGGVELAQAVVQLCDQNATSTSANKQFAYDLRLPIADKLRAISQRIYRATDITLTPAASKQIAELEAGGFGQLPICVAKTQYSFSDDAVKLGAPRDFTVTFTKLKVAAGAGFIVAYTGSVMTMPGLPKVPAANQIDVDDEGRITGLF